MTMRRTNTALLLTALLAAVAGTGRAAVFTVGDDEPAADFRTIQEGIDAALASTGFREVQVAAGHYRENLRLHLGPTAGTLHLTGGWDPTFTFRSFDPRDTVVSGGGTERALLASCGAGTLRFETLTLTEGLANLGAGGYLTASGGCRVTFDRMRFDDNRTPATGSFPNRGAGLYLTLQGSSEATVHRSVFEGNVVAGESAVGALFVELYESTELELSRSTFVENLAEGEGARGAAFGTVVLDDGQAVVFDNGFERNAVSSVDGAVAVWLRASTSDSCPGCTAGIGFQRNTLLANPPEASALYPFQHQLEATTNGDATIRLSDSLIARGEASGVELTSMGRSVIHAVNLTVADHPLVGLVQYARDVSTITLANSIFAGNGSFDVGTGAGPLVLHDNLVGGDPRFVDRARGDYRLQVGSPAVDAGTLTPPGGLAPWDLDRNDRVAGASVDQGAYELQTVSPDGEGRCAILEPLDVPRTTPACICLSDASLRELRCAFFHSDLFVTLRLPFDVLPGKPFDAKWALQPWRGVQGPYAIQASLVVDGKPQALSKPTGDGKLVDGVLSGSAVTFTRPKGEAQLRTVLRYLPAGAKKPREVVLDAMLPEGEKKP
jgi:hypothetical protein